MGDLLRKEPGRGKLYAKIKDVEVSPDTSVFTWDWLKKACKLKDIKALLAHLEAGHFGPYEIVAADNFQILEGHRAICKFNNGRYKDQAVTVFTKHQYADMMAGRPMRDMVVLVNGQIMTKPISLKNYNSHDFIAVKRYSPDQANILAIDRVAKEVDGKKVKWHTMPKKSEEYKEHFAQRVRFYNSLYLKEIALVAKDTASDEEILRAADLPASILSLIDGKLSITQAGTYVSRWLDFQLMYDSDEIKNPALSFRIHQVILEELLIEHLRDLQRLYGDKVDASIQSALKEAMARWSNLMPTDLMKKPISTNGEAKESEPPPDTSERAAPAKELVEGETGFEID